MHLQFTVKNISIYGRNRFTFHYTTIHYPLPPYQNYQQCMRFFEAKGFTADNGFPPPKWYCLTESTQRDKTVNVRYFRDLYHFNRTGLIVATLDEQELLSLYSQLGSNSAIVMKEGTVISSPVYNVLYSQVSDNSVFLKIVQSKEKSGAFVSEAKDFFAVSDGIQKDKFLITYAEIPEVKAYLIVATDYKEILKSGEIITQTTLLLMIVSLVLSVFLAALISKQLTSSIVRLKQDIKRVQEGDLSVRFKVRGNDEINWLGIYFNSMLDQINCNILALQEKERSIRENELKLLQSQINPHLLYNTLDSVTWYIENEDFGKAGQIIYFMSEFFKISFSKGRDFIPIARELEHVRNYIQLQNLCRDLAITIIVNIPDQILQLQIIKLTFQPIVENAIIHGFSGYRDDGVICISTVCLDNKIYIAIQDNGMGMTYEEVSRLNQKIKERQVLNTSDGYGLLNVNQRLKQTFGEEYGLSIESELGKGSTANIVIPVIQGMTDNQIQ